jgi:predicted alpha/beta superfamily hydrolase
MANSQSGTSSGVESTLHFPAVETHLISSKYVKQTFKVQVMRPARSKGETLKFPVVYATDGNFAFDVLKGISCSLQTSESAAAPRFILVGIGYPSDTPLAGSALRARDLTFPGYPQLDVPRGAVEGVLLPEEGTKTFYGAEDFQMFIGDELVPFIDETYETIPGQRIYFGHSAGAGFGLFTLFTKSELFRSYIISSPGLFYHGAASAGVSYENYDFVLRDARRFIASGKTLCGVRAYMSVGSGEEFEPAYAQFQLTSSFYRMVALLRAASIPGIELMTEVFPGETHMTVWPMAFIHGVQAVFGTGIWGARSE